MKVIFLWIISFLDLISDTVVDSSINVVVSSSVRPEAFGRVSVEAQAMKIPILASNLGGSKETIVNQKTGLLIESDNPNLLAESITKIMMSDDKVLEIMERDCFFSPYEAVEFGLIDNVIENRSANKTNE